MLLFENERGVPQGARSNDQVVDPTDFRLFHQSGDTLRDNQTVCIGAFRVHDAILLRTPSRIDFASMADTNVK